MFRDAEGNMFLTISDFAGTDLNGPNNLPITSVTVTSLDAGPFNGLFHNALQDFVCFGYGTGILTPSGERPVEALETGDLVCTRDNGAQPIRWIGKRVVTVTGKRCPVRFRVGALGAGLPRRDMLLSQQHRVLVRSRIVQRMFDEAEALIPAKRFLGILDIELATGQTFQGYAHFLFDRHEVVFANGAPIESLLPGEQALTTMGPAAREEIRSIFPKLATQASRPPSVRTIPTGPQQKRLAERHRRNAKALLAPVP